MEIGAPRRSPTYNPLVGRQVVSRQWTEASVLVRGRAARRRSSVTGADVRPWSDVTGDQSGNVITPRQAQSSDVSGAVQTFDSLIKGGAVRRTALRPMQPHALARGVQRPAGSRRRPAAAADTGDLEGLNLETAGLKAE